MAEAWIQAARFKVEGTKFKRGVRIISSDGRWQMADGRWQMGDGRWEMGDGRWGRRHRGTEAKRERGAQ